MALNNKTGLLFTQTHVLVFFIKISNSITYISTLKTKHCRSPVLNVARFVPHHQYNLSVTASVSPSPLLLIFQTPVLRPVPLVISDNNKKRLIEMLNDLLPLLVIKSQQMKSLLTPKIIDSSWLTVQREVLPIKWPIQ